jgi:hypothetical protein
MNEHIVSIDFWTGLGVKKPQVASLLGVAEQVIQVQRGRRNDRLCWTIESGISDDRPFDDHIESLLGLFQSKSAINPHELIQHLVLTIGAFYDLEKNAFNSTRLKNALLKQVLDKFPGIDIEIYCYPCSEDS